MGIGVISMVIISIALNLGVIICRLIAEQVLPKIKKKFCNKNNLEEEKRQLDSVKRLKKSKPLKKEGKKY